MKKSFSLIELVFSITIFVIASTLTIAISANIFKNRYKTENIINVQRNAQNIVQLFSSEIKNSNTCDKYLDELAVGEAWYFGFIVAHDGSATVRNTFGSDFEDLRGTRGPEADLPFASSKKMATASIDQFGIPHRKIYYQNNKNLYLSESLYPTGDAFGAASLYNRQINDDSVEITDLYFQSMPIIDHSQDTNPCLNGNFLPKAQNYLYLEMTIKSKIADPTGNYSLTVKKFIAQKNYKLKSEY